MTLKWPWIVLSRSNIVVNFSPTQSSRDKNLQKFCFPQKRCLVKLPMCGRHLPNVMKIVKYLSATALKCMAHSMVTNKFHSNKARFCSIPNIWLSAKATEGAELGREGYIWKSVITWLASETLSVYCDGPEALCTTLRCFMYYLQCFMYDCKALCTNQIAFLLNKAIIWVFNRSMRIG